MIRTGTTDEVNDFNVENMVLTPEDENNPQLLGELSLLVRNEVTEEQIIANIKKEALRLKREGDIEGAKLKLRELSELEREKDLESREPKIALSNEPKSPVNVPSTQKTDDIITTSPSSPKLISPDVKLYRDLFAKLQKQSTTCQAISEFYAASNRKSDSNLFIKRKQATDLEIQKLMLMLKSKQPAPQSKIVNVTYEYVLNNSEVPEGQLQVTVGQLKVILPRKFKLKESEEYKMKILYELNGLTEKEMNFTSEPFTVAGLSKSKSINQSINQSHIIHTYIQHTFLL